MTQEEYEEIKDMIQEIFDAINKNHICLYPRLYPEICQSMKTKEIFILKEDYHTEQYIMLDTKEEIIKYKEDLFNWLKWCETKVERRKVRVGNVIL